MSGSDINTSSRRHRIADYFLQFLMTFLGVSLGFFADNLREQWADERTEQSYLQSMLADLKQDTSRLNFSIRSKAVKRKKLDTLLMFLSSPERERHTGRIHYLLRYATLREPFYGNEGTIRQLENEGGFRIIRNRELVRLLNDYVSAKAKVSDIQSIRDAQSDQFKEAIARVADGRVINSMQDFERNAGLPYWLRAPVDNPPLVSERAEDISALIYWVSNENSLESMVAKLHMDLRGTAESLLNKLEQETEARD